MGMLAVAKDKLDRKLRRRKLQGGSGVSPLAASDPVTGLYYERARWYSPSLGTWISQDPLQYINGANTYQYVGSSPVGRVDPSGKSLGDILGYITTGILPPTPTAIAASLGVPSSAINPGGQGFTLEQDWQVVLAGLQTVPQSVQGMLQPLRDFGRIEICQTKADLNWLKQHEGQLQDAAQEALHQNQENGQEFLDNLDNFIQSLPRYFP